MSTVIIYKRLQIVDPTPTGDGGQALKDAFQAIDDLVIFDQGTWSNTQAYVPNDLVLSDERKYRKGD